MSLAEESIEWAEEEVEHGNPAHRERVASILAQLHAFADPESLPVGSTQRFLAQRRVDKLVEKAEALGFETSGKMLKKEIGKKLAGQALGINL